jgi:RNA polymerase sigma-70 factor, ECF subfamily
VSALDSRQLAAAVRRHTPMLRRVARRYVRPLDVDDVVQEAWLAAYAGMERYEGRGSLEHWLAAITANIGRTWGARAARSVPVGDVPDIPAPPDSEPEQRALARERLRATRAAIDGLSPTLRSSLELRDLHGLSAAEARSLLAIDDRTLRVRLHRARAQVRRTVSFRFDDDAAFAA